MWAAAGLVVAVTAAGAASPRGNGWSVATAIPIEIRAGRASIVVPTPRPESKVLVVVSALARTSQELPIRLSARSARGGDATPLPPPPLPPMPLRSLALKPRALPPSPANAAPRPPESRVFHVLARVGDPASPSNYRPVRARLRAAGQHIQIYVDEQNITEVSNQTLRRLAHGFDERIWPLAAGLFGPPRDVDGDGRLTVVCTRGLDRLGVGADAVDGLVRGADFDPRVEPPLGNGCDMVCLNTTTRDDGHLLTVLAHEYAHAVIFSRRVLDAGLDGAAKGEEGWLDEALAHLVEDLHGFSRSNIDHRVVAYLAAPERYRLVVDDYYSARLFRSHGHRGGAYLLLRWCADRLGPGLLPALVCSQQSGVENLEAAMGLSFEEMFRRWSVALFLDALSTAPDPKPNARAIGPRFARVEPDGCADCWSAPGTSAHYAVVSASAAGAVAIDVEGPGEAALQVTVARLPGDWPRLELEIEANREHADHISIIASIRKRDGHKVWLERLDWTPLASGEGRHQDASSQRVRAGAFDLAPGRRGIVLSAPGQFTSPPMALAGYRLGEGPLAFRVTGRDEAGRLVWAWADFDPTAMLATPTSRKRVRTN